MAAEHLTDTAHAADRLHHRRRLIPALAEVGLLPPEAGTENLAQIERLAERAFLVAGAGSLAVTGAAGAPIGHVLIERAEAAQKGADAFLVLGGDSLGEGVTVNRLGRQFSNVAADVVDHLPVALRLTVERRLGLQQGATVVVAHHLERHAEFAAVRQDALVVIWQPRRPRVEIHVRAGFPRDALHAAGLVNRVAAAQ